MTKLISVPPKILCYSTMTLRLLANLPLLCLIFFVFKSLIVDRRLMEIK